MHALQQLVLHLEKQVAKVRHGEQNFIKGEFTRKPMKYCTPESPCYNVASRDVWLMMSGVEQEVCPTCQAVADETRTLEFEFQGWGTTKEGRFAAWRAEQDRVKNHPVQDSSEPTSCESLITSLERAAVRSLSTKRSSRSTSGLDLGVLASFLAMGEEPSG